MLTEKEYYALQVRAALKTKPVKNSPWNQVKTILLNSLKNGQRKIAIPEPSTANLMLLGIINDQEFLKSDCVSQVFYF